MPNTKNKRKPSYGRLLLCVLLPAVLVIAGWKGLRIWRIYSGELDPEPPDPAVYPVRGVDVSRYQGTIDWDVLAGEDVSFAFIKATEGSSHQDPCFKANWRGVHESSIYAGAYHFFSFESSGATQAQNFIETVGPLKGDLPPVIDLEFYGDYYSKPLSKKETRKILDDLLTALEDHYGTAPIIYTTTRAYYSYILGGGYSRYPLWMRDTYMEPLVHWQFWQYSDKGVLEGYDGVQDDQTEVYIDLNVYKGSLEEMVSVYGLAEKEEEAAD